MKTILINVASLDGRFTKWKGKNIYEWSSQEDFKFFMKTRAENNLLVMGSSTFNHVRLIEKAGLNPEPDKLRVVLTKSPNKYKEFEVPGQLEFSNESPSDLIIRLENQGYKQMLLVSGGAVANSFFRESLVTDLWLTLEPQVFGSGKSLASGDNLDIKLNLESIKKLNDKGTLLLKYKVI